MEASHSRALLARVPEMTAVELAALVAAADGELERATRPATWRRTDLSPERRAALAAIDSADVAADVAWLEAEAVSVLLATDADYPQLLRAMPDAPAALYVRGTRGALLTPQLAMVGSRSPTSAGRASAREFAGYFAAVGLTVTSGFARGIDAASHAGALASGGSTIAVCGTALDRLYPQEHAALAARICAQGGALVSEVPPRTAPQRRHFLRRNRIIAGLAHGTLVVEAARNSVALLTARLAADCGREVFALPGSIHNPLARGCHQLIKSGAQLVEDGADVLRELQNLLSKEQVMAPVHDAPTPRALDKEYEMLLDALEFEPATIENLVARTHFPSESVASMLLILELEGRVATLPGGRYGRMR
jgi:DNA processing protein